MLIENRSHVVSALLVGFAALTFMPLESQAAPKVKPRAHIFDDLITPSMLAPPPPPTRARTAGARFFTINSVLAKLDGKGPPDQQVRLASAAPADVLSDTPDLTLPARATPSPEPFGLFTFRAPEGALWRKWRALTADITRELARVSACDADRSNCDAPINRFRAMLAEVSQRSGQARLETVNRLINGAIRYQSDLAQHGAIDVWSAPLASLTTGRGDCEDYAIAKYVLLRQAGVPESDLRILLVRDLSVNEDHAVLAVRQDNAWIVLDNRRAMLAMDSEISYLKPLYALDAHGVSLFASPYLSLRLGGPDAVAPAAADGPSLSDFDTEPTMVAFRINDVLKSDTVAPAALGDAGFLPLVF